MTTFLCGSRVSVLSCAFYYQDFLRGGSSIQTVFARRNSLHYIVPGLLADQEILLNTLWPPFYLGLGQYGQFTSYEPISNRRDKASMKTLKPQPPVTLSDVIEAIIVAIITFVLASLGVYESIFGTALRPEGPSTGHLGEPEIWFVVCVIVFFTFAVIRHAFRTVRDYYRA
jgi:hypothetical protein